MSEPNKTRLVVSRQPPTQNSAPIQILALQISYSFLTFLLTFMQDPLPLIARQTRRSANNYKTVTQ